MEMTEVEILRWIAGIIEEYVGVPAAEVTPEADLGDDLDIDSLSMVEIVVATQDKFSIEMPDDDLKHLNTVQDVVDYIQRSRVSAN